MDVEPYEVMQALGLGRRWPRAAMGPHGIPVLMIWCRTASGRPLIVVVRQKEGLDWWIIGARQMNPSEAAEFEQWEADSHE